MTKHHHTIYLIGILFTLSTCSKESAAPSQNTPSQQSTYTTFIYYKNSIGQDLLDPATPNYFTQRIFDVSYKVNNLAVVYFDTVFNNTTYPSLPAGYCFKIENSSTAGLVKYISFNKYPYTVDTLTFTYSGTTLQKLFYNKILINPPTTLSSYPAQFPVIVSK